MFYKMYKLVRFYCSLMWYVVCMVFLHFLSKKLVCLWSMCIHTPMRSHLWNMRRNIMTTFFLVSSYPINDWKLWLICFNETSIMNCSLINHNNPVLWALPFIQATAGVILHNYSKFPVFERGLWKRPITSLPRITEQACICVYKAYTFYLFF